MFNIDSYKTHVSKIKRTISEDVFSIVCNNIDGNSSNFDSLAVDLSQYSEQFSILAVAETNFNETDKNLYPIKGGGTMGTSQSIIQKSLIKAKGVV